MGVKLPIFQVDAFASGNFRGNPAAVVILDAWLDDSLLQRIAEENNLSETAFVIPSGAAFPLRWFTPETEVQLCGHATLATAHVLLTRGYAAGEAVAFETRSGTLGVRRRGQLLELDFPALPAAPVEAPTPLLEGLGVRPSEVLLAQNFLVVLGSEAAVRGLRPRFDRLRELGSVGVIATAPGDECDFVSRFFGPGVGVEEDPVTGSAHCTLVPFWSRRLGKRSLVARQVSLRGGELLCEDRGTRVGIAGNVRDYLVGEITLEDTR
jgi:predicted PhzF superfamily epimerase YddE/YHI9